MSPFTVSSPSNWWTQQYNAATAGTRGDYSIQLNYGPTGTPSMTCTPCQSNYYYVDNTRCAPCPANSTSNSGAATCNCTEAGMYMDQGQKKCVKPVYNTTLAVYDVMNGTDTFTAPMVQVTLGNTESVVILPLTDTTVTAGVCPAGAFSLQDSQVCSLCPPGTYSSTLAATSAVACIACPAGTYSGVTGASSSGACQPCSPGTYWAGTGGTSISVCAACPANSWSNAGSQLVQACVCLDGFTGPNGGVCQGCNLTTVCANGAAIPCPSNSRVYQALSFSLSDCKCEPGFYGDATMTLDSEHPVLCQPCRENSYCPGGTENLTIVCPNSTYSTSRSDDVSDCGCPANSFSKQKASSVTECSCVPGFFKVYNQSFGVAGWMCQMCAPGEFCYEDLNQTCPPHSSSPAAASSFLDCVCKPGYKNATVQTPSESCVECPPNRYCTGGGAEATCVPNAISPRQSMGPEYCFCDFGWKGLNNSACVACESPNYCYSGLQAQCSEGTSSPALSWGVMNCSCVAGRFGRAGGPCVACGAGKFKVTPGCTACTNLTDTDCALCPTGTYSTALGRNTSCDACRAGSFSLTGTTACLTCGNGTYSLDLAGACISCDLGWYAATNSSACTACPQNTYLDVYGRGSILDCQPCPEGTVSPKLGNSDPGCSACPPGTFQTSGACVSCVAGTYSRSGSIKCRDCPPGLYSLDNATACLECPRGLISAGNASGGCSACLPGTYSAFAGGSVCTRCAIGYANALTGSWNCTRCPDGMYAASGESQCSLCVAGTWAVGSIGSMEECGACGTGAYSTTLGGSSPAVCIACPAGKFSNATKAPEVSD